MAASSRSSEVVESYDHCISRGKPSSLLEKFIRSFGRPGAVLSSRDVIFLKELILSCDLISGISEDLYLELLCFLVDNWVDCCADTSINAVPILKYTNQYGRVTLCSIDMAVNRSCKICMSSDQYIHWLSIWNIELKGASNLFFIPESTQTALKQFPKREELCTWMREYLDIVEISLYDFSHAVLCNLQNTNDIDLVVGFTHFLYHSLSRKYLTEEFVSALCESMPVVDKSGRVIMARNEALVPASVSKWVELAGSNLWKGDNYIELGEDYFRRGYYVGEYAEEDQLLDFLQRCVSAVDIPDLRPPDANLPVASSPLSKDNALLLLEWIRKATISGARLPDSFLRSIQEGKWLKTSFGYKSPSVSFLCTSAWGYLLQVGIIIEDVPLVDENFYGNQIGKYMKELERLGVVSDVKECCLFIAHRLMSAATISPLTKDHVLSLLRFIRYVSEIKIACEGIMNIFLQERWLKTSMGFRAPVESIMYNKEWEAFQQISDLPYVDEAYYGEEIHIYEDELKQLGVAMGFDKRYGTIIENFKWPTLLSTLTVSSSILILECIRHSNLSSCFIDTIREHEWIKTNLGYRSPKECFLYDPGWGCLLKWAGVPLIDENFYGHSVKSYIDELGIAGVSITSEGAYKNATHHVKLLLCSSSLTKEASVSLLECCKQLRMNGHSLCGELKDCISNEKWLKTSLGCRSPSESAIYDSGWEPISQVADLAFIDESYYGESVSSYVDELDSIGVVVKYYKAFQLVVSGFKFPKHKSMITAGVVISLLECIKHQLDESLEVPLPADFLRCIRAKKWLKTCMGFRSPVKCFLYDSEWEFGLRREDAPFIDESFYGPGIASYWKELSCMGVKVRVGSGCRLISQCLKSHTNFSAIVRIYSYLDRFNWEPEPEEKSECWIWIPNENYDAGEWVSSNHCVLHVMDHATSSALKILDRYYDKKLLPFFSTAFGVGLHCK